MTSEARRRTLTTTAARPRRAGSRRVRRTWRGRLELFDDFGGDDADIVEGFDRDTELKLRGQYPASRSRLRSVLLLLGRQRSYGRVVLGPDDPATEEGAELIVVPGTGGAEVAAGSDVDTDDVGLLLRLEYSGQHDEQDGDGAVE